MIKVVKIEKVTEDASEMMKPKSILDKIKRYQI